MVVAGGGAELFGKEPAIEEAHADSSMADANFFLFFREERVLQLFREHLFQVVVVAGQSRLGQAPGLGRRRDAATSWGWLSLHRGPRPS